MNTKIYKIIFGLLFLMLVVFIFQPAFNGKKIVLAVTCPGGMTGDPCEITNWTQLQAMNDALDHNYILMNNLDAFTAGYINFQLLLGFEPVGDSFNQFTGTFNGSNFHIIGLFIDRPGNDYVGLFGYVSSGSVVSIVSLVNVNITGKDFVGGLVGRNLGAISSSYSSGFVNGADSVGGLVGVNDGNVSNSYSTGSVTGTGNFVGGLVGGNVGPIINSYSHGNVTGSDFVGGLVGVNPGTVSNSYSTGSVTGGGSNVGGFVGFDDSGTYTANFWDIETTGNYDDSGNTGDLVNVTGLPSSDMTIQLTFTSAGWDFTIIPIWKSSNSYPCLQWQANETCVFPPVAPVLGNFLMGMAF